MTTGRINQVAIRIAAAVRYDCADRSTDVRSPLCSSHESSYTVNGHHHRQAPDGRGLNLRPTELFTVRLPSTRFEVGIRKTVKVEVP